MKHLLPAALLSLTIWSSCQKHNVVSGPPPDDSVYRELKACTIDARYDSSTLATSVLGEWREVWFEWGGARHPSDSNLHYTYRSDNRYTSTINGRNWGAGHWFIAPADGEYFKLIMADTVHTGRNLPNRILSCGDGLFLEDSARNGGNQYFVRVR